MPLVEPGTRFTAIAAGYGHNLALKSNRTVVAWGGNSEGQNMVPTGLDSVVAIAGGERHSLALKSNRTVYGWFENNLVEGMRINAPANSRGREFTDAINQYGAALMDPKTVIPFEQGINQLADAVQKVLDTPPA